MKAAFSKAQFESELSSRFGSVFKPREKSPTEVIPTGVTEVDTLTGGLPRGAITEIFGLASSGRTSLILSALAEATTRGEVCAVVDTTDAFHPASASGAGTQLDQLLWLRCSSVLEHAFKATDLLLQGGGFGLVLLDLGDVPAKDARRIISSWWYRFRRVVENTPTAFVVVAQDSCVRSCASLTLEIKCEFESWRASSIVPDASERTPFLRQLQQKKFPRSAEGSAPAEYHPTHSNLLRGLHLRLERQKPVNLNQQFVTFRAAISH